MMEGDSASEAADSTGSAPAARPPIVGIGSSAGGIDALRRLLPLLPADPPMAFVIVQHLGAGHKSILPEMLARVTALPVRLIEHGMIAEGGIVYVIPAAHTLTIEGRRLLLGPVQEGRGARITVDTFLASLAASQGENAACVILSGTGSDGTQGVRAIKEHGGLTIAQAEAEYDGMMRSALATGLVDHVIPLEDIPRRLAEYFGYLGDLGRNGGTGAVREQATVWLAQISTLLRTRTGHDFKDYKPNTVVRRVQRRMQVLQIAEVPAFVDRLRRDHREVDLLFQDMLIGVTGFFRDRAAFEALEREVIPRLFAGKGADDTVRVWIAGCASGEEAYSIAMLLRDHAPKGPGAPRIQVFASDIDDKALEVARGGRYPASIADSIPAERLARYFVREEGSFRVVTELREICLFSAHNLLRDAPFSRLDLISCRNLLIYLNAEMQNRVIPLFHYALCGDGHLLLGTSENVSRHGRLFAVVDKPNRLFRRRPQAERRLPEFPLTAPPRIGAYGERRRPPMPDGTVQTLVERRVLDLYAPAYVVVNRAGDVLHVSARTGRYLELSSGAPDNNIFSLARSAVRPELRAALHRAATTGEIAGQTGLDVGSNGTRQSFDMFVQPLLHDRLDDPLFLIVFKDTGDVRPDPAASGASAEETESAHVRHLEQELRATRERLETATEELDSSNEELKSSNEELTSMNEELQSANEELETSREELQSINEELQTVNSELSVRVEELGRANADLANLLESTQIATLFLDADLRVKGFTPAAKDVFRLVESDPGRPISHVRARFTPDTVAEDAARVLQTLTSTERQVRSLDTDQSFVMRLLPYRTLDNTVNGVVITFTDVARISAAEARISQLAHDLRNRIENLETLLDLVPVGIFIIEDVEAQQVRTNRRGARLIGEAETQRGLGAIGPALRLRVGDADLPPEAHPLRRAAATGEPVGGFEAQIVRPDGSEVAAMISATPLFTEAAVTRGAIAAVVDITDIKDAEAHQKVLLHELQHRVKNILATVGALASRILLGTDSLDGFRDGFLPRLLAMGRMHDLLSQRNWQGMELRDLLLASLDFYAGPGSGTVSLDGPAVTLPPDSAATLGMILQELATNAAKYGALSVKHGRLEIVWRLSRHEVELDWCERGGPEAAKPATEGFGIGFVRRSVEYEMDGSFTQAFDAEGVRCRITFPLPSDN